MTYVAARFYKNVKQARKACDALKKEGFSERTYAMITPSGDGDGNSTANLVEALRAGMLLSEHADFYAKNLADGLALVVVQPPFGNLKRAEEILITNGALTIKHNDPYEARAKQPLRRDPAPLSGFFGFKALSDSPQPTFEKWGWRLLSSDGKPSMSRALPELTSSHFTLTGMFGLLSRSPAPLSGMTGMPTLSNKAAPLSGMAGLPLLTSKKRMLYR
jgi:hypothetical protein